MSVVPVLSLVITLNIFVAVEAPPAATCFVQTTLFRGGKTACGGGALRKMSELVGQRVSADVSFGAQNMADLILSRGGIFDYEQQNLEVIHVCALHQNQLGAGWTEEPANRPKKRVNTKLDNRCNIPPIEGFKTHQTTTFARPYTYVTKQEAAAVMSQKSVLIALGTAMCANHQNFFRGLTCANDAAMEEAAGEAEATGPSPDEATTSEVPTKRRRTACQYMESPIGHSTWRGAGSEVCDTSPQLQTPGRGAAAGDTSYDPSSAGSSSRAGDSPTQQTCEQVKQGIRFIAAAIGIPARALNFGKWKNFDDLAPDYRRQKVSVARKVTDAVMSAFAPDASQELFKSIAKKYITDMWDKENSEQFTQFVEGVIDLYRDAATRQQRMQTLALIAPVMRYLEIQKFLPSLTMYAYKEARRYSKLFKAGMATPPTGPTPPRKCYRKHAVERFIFFITSPNVVSDMPFGHVTVKLSSGLKQELPNLVRTTVNQRIIQQYKSYLNDTGHEDLLMSDSTMLRILHACKAMTRKSLMGLDYYTYEGIEGISDLIELAEELKAKDGDAEWAKETISKLKELKTFFKTDYKIKIQQDSPFSDYSRSYALSDPKDRLLQAPGLRSETEMRRSPQIIALWQTFQSIENKIEEIVWANLRDKSEAEFVLAQAKTAIYEWQKHIVRTINQNDGKAEILQDLPADGVWVLMDWAMKFLPRKGIEGATEWFGKRGINWHISYALVKTSLTDYAYRIYVHIFDPVGQVPETTLAIMQDVLERVKSERPSIARAYFRSDNANCYHSTETLAAINAISQKTGVKILRYDFSDPQSGKDACDRATSVIKRHINIFVAENHPCTTAAELLKCGSSHNGVGGTTFIHAGLKEAPGGRGKGTIAEVSKLHNWDFSGPKPRAWNAYKIGEGKLPRMTERADPLPRLEPIHTVATYRVGVHNNLLQDHNAWGGLSTKTIPQNEQETAPDEPDGWVADESDETEAMESDPSSGITADVDADAAEGRTRQRLFPCEEDGCTKVYQTYHNWYKHVTIGRHTKRLERESLADFSIKTYAESIRNSIVRPFPSISNAVTSQQTMEDVLPEGIQRQKPGWAHKTRKPSKRFTADQKAFLHEKFDEGAATGRKYNPQEAEKLMRKDPRFPDTGDWLTKTQIASYWSRLSNIREKTGAATATTPEGTPPPLTAQQRRLEQAEREDLGEVELEEVAADEYANGFSEHIDEAIRAVVDRFVVTDDNC